jgi:hypothetical protein
VEELLVFVVVLLVLVLMVLPLLLGTSLVIVVVHWMQDYCQNQK